MIGATRSGAARAPPAAGWPLADEPPPPVATATATAAPATATTITEDSGRFMNMTTRDKWKRFAR
ncbi:MAG: hypothetical protein HS111_15245 [Kofleriaceae bacterium]|nr:hypothetical protein [Kofleriaceae bacterium]